MFKLGSRFLFVIFIAVILSSPFSGFAQDNEVEFDNQSGQPALVKLIGPTMRKVNVPINSKLSVTALPGSYHIMVRYGTSKNYQYRKGEKFEVTETATKQSKTTITLHKVIGGNYVAKPISEDEFAASAIQNSVAVASDQSVEKTSQQFGTVVGVLAGTPSNEAVLKYKLKPFATKKVKIQGMDLWEELLPDYKEVSPDENRKFMMPNVPPGVYSLRAIVGEAKGPAGEKLPVWEFVKNAGGSVVKFQVKPNEVTDLGTIKVITK